jgi:hypothetical protein
VVLASARRLGEESAGRSAGRRGYCVRVGLFVVCICLAGSAGAQQPGTQTTVPSTALTIYNEDFAVARTPIELDLHSGVNEVTTNAVTTKVEPDSVVLRDASGKHSFRIVEQNYDAGVVDQAWMLRKFEGKTITFRAGTFPVGAADQESHPEYKEIQGKIIRAPRNSAGYSPYATYQANNEPLIEVDGHLQFQLPGLPLFPATTDGLLLKPELRWEIESGTAQKFSAELAYITNGLGWDATYNVVAARGGEATNEEKADLSGWVTIRNESGTEFPAARIKLMAGDVAKIQPRTGMNVVNGPMMMAQSVSVNGEVTQKPFDDFHLYDLNRTVSLKDGETKQVQFIDAAGMTLERTYVYDGGESITPQMRNNFNYGGVNQQPNFGLNADNSKVQIVEQFKNTQANHLGIPLPAGRIRLYRQDADGQMEFVGESMINHTPVEDTVKITTGSAFDVKGARKQTDFHINQNAHDLDESFAITLTNQKAEPVKVRVVEHMNRGENWEIQEKSADYTKVDSHTLEFPVEVPAKGEAKLTYSVRYTW